ncbi:MAG: hypothetical protein ACRDH6_01570 [Actinomycetota bacterium]
MESKMRRLGVATLVLVFALGSAAGQADTRARGQHGSSRQSNDLPSDRLVFEISEEVQPPYALLGFSIQPIRGTLFLGGEVVFRNVGTVPHQLEEENGFFTWSPIPAGEEERFLPWAAGTYEFRNRLAPLLGPSGEWDEASFTVQLRWGGPPFRGLLGLVNRKRSRTTPVRWASQAAPTGLVYDVQVRDSEDAPVRWRWWKRGVSEPAGRYRFRGGPVGPYEYICLWFRARLRDADDATRRSGWSFRGTCIDFGFPPPPPSVRR